MNNAVYNSLFARAQAGHPNFVEVPMDTSGIAIVPPGGSGAIVTRRLGGCSGVVILGRSAAIMAHIAPRPPATVQTATASRQHFSSLLGQVEQLYNAHRAHFPSGTTSWGVYVSGFAGVTDDLKGIAVQRLSALGLTNQHTYYSPIRGANDEVRVCVLLQGPGRTLLYLEGRLLDDISFPTTPDRHASRRGGPLAARSYLLFSMRAQIFTHVLYGQHMSLDTDALSGVYDVLDDRGPWVQFDFTAKTWVTSRNG